MTSAKKPSRSKVAKALRRRFGNHVKTVRSGGIRAYSVEFKTECLKHIKSGLFTQQQMGELFGIDPVRFSDWKTGFYAIENKFNSKKAA